MGFVGLVATVLAVWGPPTLPPLPGQRGEPAPTKPTPAKPTPAKPTPAKPTPAKPAPAQPTQAKPTASTPTVGRPATAAPASPSATPIGPAPAATPLPPPPSGPAPQPGVPATAAPPQPSSSGAPTGPAVDEPGAAPPMLAPEGASLPGATEDAPERLRFPPPKRPPYSGTGLFIGAGVTLAVAIAEQVVAHILVKRRCIDPIAADQAMMNVDPIPIDPTDPPTTGELTGSDEFGEIVSQCAPGVVPALALRVHSDIGLLATVGLAAAGGANRGRQRAFDAVFRGGSTDYGVGLRAAGITLIATGVVTWFSTGAASWAWLGSCKTARCATRARLMNFTTRDTAAVLAATGGALLAFAEVRRRSTDRFIRDRALSVGLSRVPGGALLAVGGRL